MLNIYVIHFGEKNEYKAIDINVMYNAYIIIIHSIKTTRSHFLLQLRVLLFLLLLLFSIYVTQ